MLCGHAFFIFLVLEVIFVSKNKEHIIDSSNKPIYISLIVLIPFLFLFVWFALWLLDSMMLNQEMNFFTSLSYHKKEILVITVCLWALAFYYIAGSIKIGGGKMEEVGTGKWSTLSEQKKYFGIAPIDTTQKIEVGGSPVNKISDTELMYEKASFHDYIIGTTGSGKSRKIVRQLVMLASMADESMIFHDPKKEMYNAFHKYLENKGYTVHCIDFRNPEFSDHWNPLDDITYWTNLDKEDEADEYTQDQVESIVVDNGKSEPIWIEGQKALIASTMMEVASAPIADSKKNYYSVLQMISVLGKEMKIDKQDKMLLSVYMESLDETSASRLSFAPIAVSKDKTTSSFLTTALASIRPFSGTKLMKVLSKSDFHFKDYKEGKHALFIVDPDEKKRYNPITAMIVDSAYKTLVYEANQRDDTTLKKRVHFILDEFGNMAKVPNFDTKMTVARSRNILFHLYLQDYAQMNEKYGDNIAKIIRGNCNLWYFISCPDAEVCRDISQQLGQYDIKQTSMSSNYNPNVVQSGSSISEQTHQKPLLSADELQRYDVSDGNGIIVYRANLGFSRVQLPDCSQYKWYKEMQTEIVRERKDNFELEYAIPRYIVISRRILLAEGITYVDNEEPTPPRDEKSAEPLSAYNMYWYWSTRDDLGNTVARNVLNALKERQDDLANVDGLTPHNLIREYMKSQRFVQWLQSIDVKKDSSDEAVKKVSETLKSEESESNNEEQEKYSNALDELWG